MSVSPRNKALLEWWLHSASCDFTARAPRLHALRAFRARSVKPRTYSSSTFSSLKSSDGRQGRTSEPRTLMLSNSVRLATARRHCWSRAFLAFPSKIGGQSFQLLHAIVWWAPRRQSLRRECRALRASCVRGPAAYPRPSAWVRLAPSRHPRGGTGRRRLRSRPPRAVPPLRRRCSDLGCDRRGSAHRGRLTRHLPRAA
jgi:hypothetical protein